MLDLFKIDSTELGDKCTLAIKGYTDSNTLIQSVITGSCYMIATHKNSTPLINLVSGLAKVDGTMSVVGERVIAYVTAILPIHYKKEEGVFKLAKKFDEADWKLIEEQLASITFMEWTRPKATKKPFDVEKAMASLLTKAEDEGISTLDTLKAFNVNVSSDKAILSSLFLSSINTSVEDMIDMLDVVVENEETE